MNFDYLLNFITDAFFPFADGLVQNRVIFFYFNSLYDDFFESNLAKPAQKKHAEISYRLNY